MQFIYIYTVLAIVWQRLAGQIVGTKHQPVSDCLHRSRNDWQTGAQHTGRVQPHRRLRSVSRRGNHIVVLVEFAQRVSPASHVARSQRTDSFYRSLANPSGVPNLFG